MRQTLLWLLGVGSAGIALVFVLTAVREPVVPRATTAPVERVAAPEDAPQPRTEQSGSQRDAAPPVTRPSEVGTTEERAAAAKEKVVFKFEDEPAMRGFIALWRDRESLLTRLRTLEEYWNREEAALAQFDHELAADSGRRDENETGKLTVLRQQRQGVTLRMKVLQEYWDRTQALLVTLSDTLTSNYNVDFGAQYLVNLQQRVLIRRETPPSVPATANRR